jgi:hypothetical protein
MRTGRCHHAYLHGRAQFLGGVSARLGDFVTTAPHLINPPLLAAAKRFREIAWTRIRRQPGEYCEALRRFFERYDLPPTPTVPVYLEAMAPARGHYEREISGGPQRGDAPQRMIPMTAKAGLRPAGRECRRAVQCSFTCGSARRVSNREMGSRPTLAGRAAPSHASCRASDTSVGLTKFNLDALPRRRGVVSPSLASGRAGVEFLLASPTVPASLPDLTLTIERSVVKRECNAKTVVLIVRRHRHRHASCRPYPSRS